VFRKTSDTTQLSNSASGSDNRILKRRIITYFRRIGQLYLKTQNYHIFQADWTIVA